MKEELLPVCSPNYLKNLSYHNLGDVDLSCLTLLQHSTRPNMWSEYLSQTARPTNDKFIQTLEHGIVFEHFFMLIDATTSGQGIALIPKILIEEELKSKTLVVAFSDKFTSPYQYKMIYKNELQNNAAIQSFLSWFTNKSK